MILHTNIKKHSSDVEWRVWFAIISRQLWLNRNAGVFQGRAMGACQVVCQSRALTRWSKDQLCRLYIGEEHKALWRPPYMGWIKYNADGACVQNGALAGCGGIARDHSGRFQDGFMFNIGRGSSLHAEIWAVLWSLKRAWESHWRKVIVETDCWELVQLINLGWEEDHPEGNLFLQVSDWLHKDWDVQVDWCSRDVNVVADTLAKEALQRGSGLTILVSPPDFIGHLLLPQGNL